MPKQEQGGNPLVTQQLLTPYQSQYYAWLLTRRAASDTVESLASTLVDSQVDLNPHQVEAALFACTNPLSRGVILADEVGLGKTIEAGLVISQRWAVTLFPGMELSCNGGVHLKVILDPSKGTSDIEAIRGSVGYSGTPGDSDGVTSQSVEQVIRVIQLAGGVACAAHVDQPKGLLISLTDHNTLQPIFKLLDAIEVIDPAANCLQPHAAALADLAHVLGSDSHQPSEIGRGYTWVKMSAPSIEGLKLALLDPESAIRRSDQCANYPQQLNHPKIKSITVEKLRLRQKDPLTIPFNPSYNALIGGRGSGKSTILECLRLGLARENELLTGRSDSALKQSFENFKKEKTGRNQPGMMLHDTRISVEVAFWLESRPN
jgi:hypothetical protein